MAEIPVFKERRMTGISNETRLMASYLINSSYAGILRLSPNNSATLLGTNSTISLNDVTENLINYTDSVGYHLERQFLDVTTSDGILLDMKISQDGVEYNNLYVQGAVSVPNMVIYANNKNVFKLGNCFLPVSGNTDATVNETPTLYTEPNFENLDETYILVNTANDGEPAKFEYKNVLTLFQELIAAELSRLATLPTGSIHWVPLSIHQYEALLKKSDGSRYAHNSSSNDCDPIIRDFLLCDGALYKNKDFPELAKILYKESMVSWCLNSETEPTIMFKEEVENMVNTDEKTFRVPDLRSMFLEYLVPKEKYLNKKFNKTGSWQIDSSNDPIITAKTGMDKHYHYIVLDTSSKNQHNTPMPQKGGKDNFYSGSSIELIGAIDGEKINPKALPLVKYAGMASGGFSGDLGPDSYLNSSIGCDTRNCSFWTTRHSGNFVSRFGPYVIGKLDNDYNFCNSVNLTYGYVLSGSTRYKEDGNRLDISEYRYHSSMDYRQDVPITENNVKYLNYTKEKNDVIEPDENQRDEEITEKYICFNADDSKQIYLKEKNYVTYNNKAYEMLKKENTPEFFACLPLIKI